MPVLGSCKWTGSGDVSYEVGGFPGFYASTFIRINDTTNNMEIGDTSILGSGVRMTYNAPAGTNWNTFCRDGSPITLTKGSNLGAFMYASMPATLTVTPAYWKWQWYVDPNPALSRCTNDSGFGEAATDCGGLCEYVWSDTTNDWTQTSDSCSVGCSCDIDHLIEDTTTRQGFSPAWPGDGQKARITCKYA